MDCVMNRADISWRKELSYRRAKRVEGGKTAEENLWVRSERKKSELEIWRENED